MLSVVRVCCVSMVASTSPLTQRLLIGVVGGTTVAGPLASTAGGAGGLPGAGLPVAGGAPGVGVVMPGLPPGVFP